MDNTTRMRGLGLPNYSERPPSQIDCPLTFVAYMNSIDFAWFKKVKKDHKTKEGLFKQEAFGCIECITIERFYQDYLASNGDKVGSGSEHPGKAPPQHRVWLQVYWHCCFCCCCSPSCGG